MHLRYLSRRRTPRWLCLPAGKRYTFPMWTRSFCALCLLLGVGVSAPRQTAGPSPQLQQLKVRRLILMDGSYELIRRYEIKGSRVRFLSSDRGEWEEMPVSMVDWPATEKYARGEASTKEVRAEESRAEDEHAKAQLDASAPEVAPGIRLPDSGGTYMLDVFRGRQQLIHLVQNGADINRNTGSNILRGIINPVSGSRRSIELKGAHAATQAHIADPLIYLAVDPEADYTPKTAQGHFRIVRCESKKGNRVVGAVSVAIYGKVKQQAGFVETRIEPVAGPWIRVRPASSLSAGEYALVEMLGEKGMNTYVWDFGFDPAAPGNPDAREAAPAKSGEPPVLQKPRKK